MSQVATYLSTAISTINKAGFPVPQDQQALTPMMPLILKIESVHGENAKEIARVMQQSSHFNEVVRSSISSVNIGNRYAEIAGNFNSIIDDMQKMMRWIETGPLGFGKRVSLKLNNIIKGTVNQRFAQIRKTFEGSTTETGSQIQKEETIMEAYKQYRFAVKNAEVFAQETMQKAFDLRAEEQKKLDAAVKAIEGAANDTERAQLELNRDVAIDSYQKSDEVYQISKDIADELKSSYNASELIFAHINQNLQLKKRIYQKSVTFFNTNEVVFTGLEVAFTNGSGLFEATETLNAMSDVANRGTETLASFGTANMKNAMKAGYGPSLKAQSMKVLADAIISFQEEMGNEVAQLRKEATDNSLLIESINNESKDRFVQILQKTQ